ncbi:MAG: DUF6457 domain-containing protein [Candidatus Nanopelagicales bacterium]|nr:DUF6457 domain-containing protein [Candidatus Nanopelagicales bacterium]
MSAMEQTKAWVDRAARELGVDDEIEVEELLLLTRDVAHQVTRPAAPLTTYLVGVAVARGMALDDARAAVARCLTEWEPIAED